MFYITFLNKLIRLFVNFANFQLLVNRFNLVVINVDYFTKKNETFSSFALFYGLIPYKIRK